MSQSITENEITCEHCQATLVEDDYITTDDNSAFCDATCAERGGYFFCHECGEWVNEDYKQEDPEGRAIFIARYRCLVSYVLQATCPARQAPFP